jgi:hypothetical protein
MGVKLHLMSAVAIKIGNSTIVTEVDDVAAIKVLPCKPNLKIESSMWIERPSDKSSLAMTLKSCT